MGILHHEIVDSHTIISSLAFSVLQHNTAYILPARNLGNRLKKIPTKKNDKLNSFSSATSSEEQENDRSDIFSTPLTILQSKSNDSLSNQICKVG